MPKGKGKKIEGVPSTVLVLTYPANDKEAKLETDALSKRITAEINGGTRMGVLSVPSWMKVELLTGGR